MENGKVTGKLKKTEAAEGRTAGILEERDMALLHCEIASKALEMATQLRVILPEEGNLAQAKVLYLLHGLTDNCASWTRYTAIERYARERNIAVVMPEVQRSWYCDMENGLDYFRYVSRELPQICHRLFGLSLQREKNYIAGLSMGGFGALKTALTYPDQYAGVGSFSGAVDLDAILKYGDTGALRSREAIAIFGPEQVVGPENDLKQLAAQAENLPEIYLSCGEEDLLYGVNNVLHACLEELGISHRYDHRPGNHTWDFWDQSIRDCLEYLQL